MNWTIEPLLYIYNIPYFFLFSLDLFPVHSDYNLRTVGRLWGHLYASHGYDAVPSPSESGDTVAILRPMSGGVVVVSLCTIPRSAARFVLQWVAVT